MNFPIASVPTTPSATTTERTSSWANQTPTSGTSNPQNRVGDTFTLAQVDNSALKTQLKRELEAAQVDFNSRMNGARSVQEQKAAVVNATRNLMNLENKLPPLLRESLYKGDGVPPHAQSRDAINQQMRDVQERIEYLRRLIN